MGDRDAMERRLRDLGRHVDWPEPSDLGSRVTARVGARPPRRRTGRLVAAAAVALMAMTLLFPGGRRAVADLLGVAGIEIQLTSEEPRDFAGDLELGGAVSPTEAETALGERLRLPTLVEPPAELLVPDAPSAAVWAVWEPAPELPAVGDTGVGLLLLQLRPEDGGGFHKAIGADSLVEEVMVGGSPGFWIEGAPHQLHVRTPEGETLEDFSRLAANVLLWEEDGITYRIESALDLAENLALAASMAPAG
jgi:hypothetical protein